MAKNDNAIITMLAGIQKQLDQIIKALVGLQPIPDVAVAEIRDRLNQLEGWTQVQGELIDTMVREGTPC